jgi:hypothetical protein
MLSMHHAVQHWALQNANVHTRHVGPSAQLQQVPLHLRDVTKHMAAAHIMA